MELKIFINDKETEINKNEIIREYLEEQQNIIKEKYVDVSDEEIKNKAIHYIQCISFLLFNLG